MPDGLLSSARAPEVTRLAVSSELATHGGGGSVRAAVRMGGGVFRVAVLDRGPDRAHVALVPTTALLLSGDHVRLEVEVGAGCLLEVTEPAGTVAYDMDGGAASWEVDVRVRDGGALLWHAPEFVVSQGARVVRRTTVRLEGDARCLLRETLVLGRTGESPGLLATSTRVFRDGLPLLVEDLAAGPGAQVPGVLGGHRVVDQVLDLRTDGGSVPVDGGSMRLGGGGALHRRLARSAHEGSLDPTWAVLAREHRRPAA